MERKRTRHALRQAFPSLRTRISSLWTSFYYVATAGVVSDESIRRYIETPKNV